jgi:lipase
MKKPETLYLTIDGNEISYMLYDGGGPTVILLHATGFVPWLWHPIARTLSSHYRVIVPNLCDRPGKSPEAGGISWKLLAKDMALLCERLRIETPFFVGHSMGGVVATITHGAYGIKAGAMVLIEPIFLPGHLYDHPMTVDTHPLASKALRRTNHWRDRTEALRYLLSRPLFALWDREVLDLYIAHGMIKKEGGLSLACPPEQEAALFMGGMGYNPWPLLPAVSCPVLVVEGATSENRHFIDLAEVVSALPQGSYRLVTSGGHLLPMEQPETMAGIIEDFFRKFQSDTKNDGYREPG